MPAATFSTSVSILPTQTPRSTARAALKPFLATQASKSSDHSDNGFFTSTTFKAECALNRQQLSLSGVDAHHQNGIAEHNIKTVSQWACSNLLHASAHWPSQISIKLWPQALDYAAWNLQLPPLQKPRVQPTQNLDANQICLQQILPRTRFWMSHCLRPGASPTKWPVSSKMVPSLTPWCCASHPQHNNRQNLPPIQCCLQQHLPDGVYLRQ